jgi:hypothetical protein
MNKGVRIPQESYQRYAIDILLPSDPGTGEDKITINMIGVSHYHAIEKAISLYRHLQSDRKKYIHVPSAWNKIIVR